MNRTFRLSINVVLYVLLLTIGTVVKADTFDCDTYSNVNGDLASPGSLTAANYGLNVAEIFWTPDQYDPDLLPFVEIWLDDEQFDTVYANGSYLFRLSSNTSLRDRAARIRVVDRCGRASPFSETVIIPSFTETIANRPPAETEFDCDMHPLPSPGSLSVAREGSRFATVFWVPDQYHPDLLTQAELWLDGAFIERRFANGSFGFNSAFQPLEEDILGNRVAQIRIVDRCDRESDFSLPLTIPTYARTLEESWAAPVPMTIEEVQTPEMPGPIDPAICEAFGPLMSPGELTAARYGETFAEIFWQPDQYHPDLLTRVSVQLNKSPVETAYRNGSYQFSVRNGTSLDNGEAEIRIVDRCGRISPVSDTVVIPDW